jgi:hypothetical protein
MDNAALHRRAKLIRHALAAAADHHASVYLDGDLASEAVAAAVAVASLLPDRPPIDSAQSLAFMQQSDIAAQPQTLARLALRALNRIDGANSELPDFWSDDYVRVLQDRQPVRAALEHAAANERATGVQPVHAEAAKARTARKRVRFTPGSVLLVPAGIHRALAVMTAREPFIAFYGCDRDPEPSEIPALCAGRPLFVVGVDRAAYATGHWGPVLWRLPEQDVPAIPPIFHQDVINGACSIIEPGVSARLLVSREECIGLERQASWSKEHIESRLEDHYEGRPNVWVEAMRVKI